MPDELKDRYETEPHEYLVASRSEYLTGPIFNLEYGDEYRCTPVKSIIYADADIVGYVDLTANISARSNAWMRFTVNYPRGAYRDIITQEQADEQKAEYERVSKIFQPNKIYRVKGLPPISRPDLQMFNNEYHMQSFYVLEVLSEGEDNEYLQNLLDMWYDPVTLHSEEFGDMVLDKELMWFSVEKQWRRKPFYIRLRLEDENEDTAEGLASLEQFWKKKANWDKKLRAFAAKELLSLANDWASSDDDHPGRVWTKESFAKALKNESLVLNTDGSFEMWYDDGGIFFGHAVVVYGDVKNGAKEAKYITACSIVFFDVPFDLFNISRSPRNIQIVNGYQLVLNVSACPHFCGASEEYSHFTRTHLFKQFAFLLFGLSIVYVGYLIGWDTLSDKFRLYIVGNSI